MGDNDKIWQKFLSRHWKMFALIIIGAILAAAGAIYVLLWFVGEAQLIGLVPSTLGLWTMGNVITFIIRLILWEALYVGIPAIIAVVCIYYLWWRRLPDKERKEYKDKKLFGKSSRRSDGGSAITFLVNIFFIIKVYLDGNWDKAFASWEFDYLVYSYLTALLWVLIIFAIPVSLGLIYWIHSKASKK